MCDSYSEQMVRHIYHFLHSRQLLPARIQRIQQQLRHKICLSVEQLPRHSRHSLHHHLPIWMHSENHGNGFREAQESVPKRCMELHRLLYCPFKFGDTDAILEREQFQSLQNSACASTPSLNALAEKHAKFADDLFRINTWSTECVSVLDIHIHHFRHHRRHLVPRQALSILQSHWRAIVWWDLAQVG